VLSTVQCMRYMYRAKDGRWPRLSAGLLRCDAVAVAPAVCCCCVRAGGGRTALMLCCRLCFSCTTVRRHVTLLQRSQRTARSHVHLCQAGGIGAWRRSRSGVAQERLIGQLAGAGFVLGSPVCEPHSSQPTKHCVQQQHGSNHTSTNRRGGCGTHPHTPGRGARRHLVRLWGGGALACVRRVVGGPLGGSSTAGRRTHAASTRTNRRVGCATGVTHRLAVCVLSLSPPGH
jgi:hypothetical protein